jgi:hypothetical protein
MPISSITSRNWAVPSRFSASALIAIRRRTAATILTIRNGSTTTLRRAMTTRMAAMSSVKMKTFASVGRGPGHPL